MKFKVITPFTLRHDSGEVEKFEVGDHDREEAVALHWYVQQHTDKPPPAITHAGTPQHAAALRALAAKRKALYEEAEAALAESEALLEQRGAALEEHNSPAKPEEQEDGEGEQNPPPADPAVQAALGALREEDGEQNPPPASPSGRRSLPPATV